MQLAQTLIRNWFTRSFDFTSYDDRYRKQVKALIRAKVEGREIVKPGEEEGEPQVVNLLEALKQSVAQTNGRGKRGGRKRRSA